MRITGIIVEISALRTGIPLLGVVATLAVGCTEYGFKGNADASGAGDGDTGFDPGTDSDFSDLCEIGRAHV